MSPLLGWALAAAVAFGWTRYGWPGLLLALGVVVFWLLLPFSRALRAMQQAGRSPVGHVDSALMLNVRLHAGMTMRQVIGLTRSLGQRVEAIDAEPERWRWADESGASVVLTLRGGKLAHWRLDRRDAPGAPPAGAPEPDEAVRPGDVA